MELYKYKKINNSLDISIFEGRGLRDYVKVRKYVCCSEHCQPCKKCPPLLKVVEKIIEEGCIRLNEAVAICNPGLPYNSSRAKRKLLQMPLAAIKIPAPDQGGVIVYLVG